MDYCNKTYRDATDWRVDNAVDYETKYTFSTLTSHLLSVQSEIVLNCQGKNKW